MRPRPSQGFFCKKGAPAPQKPLRGGAFWAILSLAGAAGKRRLGAAGSLGRSRGVDRPRPKWKPGASPARSRRCKWGADAKMSLVHGPGRPRRHRSISQNTCLQSRLHVHAHLGEDGGLRQSRTEPPGFCAALPFVLANTGHTMLSCWYGPLFLFAAPYTGRQACGGADLSAASAHPCPRQAAGVQTPQ